MVAVNRTGRALMSNVWQGLGDGKSISQKNGANAMKPHAFTLFLNKSTRLKNKNRLSKQVHIRDRGRRY